MLACSGIENELASSVFFRVMPIQQSHHLHPTSKGQQEVFLNNEYLNSGLGPPCLFTLDAQSSLLRRTQGSLKRRSRPALYEQPMDVIVECRDTRCTPSPRVILVPPLAS